MLLCLLQVRINFCFVLRFCYCNALHRWELMGTLNSGADIEKAIHYLWHCQLYSVQKVELLHGVYKLDFALQNSSEYHLITNLSNSSEISSMKNLNKEIVFLIINFLKTSEHFLNPCFEPVSVFTVFIFFFFYLFKFYLFIPHCTGLTVGDHSFLSSLFCFAQFFVGIIQKVRHSQNWIFDPLSSMSHFIIFPQFSSPPPPPMSFTKKWQTMAWSRRRFFVCLAA